MMSALHRHAMGSLTEEGEPTRSHMVVSFQLQGKNVVAPSTVMFHLVEFVKSFGPVKRSSRGETEGRFWPLAIDLSEPVGEHQEYSSAIEVAH